MALPLRVKAHMQQDHPTRAPLIERRVAGFHVAEVAAEDAAAFILPPAGVSQISAIFRGALRQSESPRFDVSSGHLIFTPPDVLREVAVVEGPLHLLLIRPDPDRLRSLEPFFAQPWNVTTMGLAEFHDLPLRVVRSLWVDSRARDVALEGAVLTLIAAGAEILAREGHRRTPVWLRRVDAYIEANLQHPISLSSVAGAVRVSRTLLADTFRVVRRMTLGDFIRSRRLQRACVLLRSTVDPIADVALACGFCDQSHLTRAFREALEVTPAHYRRVHAAVV